MWPGLKGACTCRTRSGACRAPLATPRLPPSTPRPPQALAAEELAGAALALSHYQAQTDADEVDLDLIEVLLQYICEVRWGWAGLVGLIRL